MSVDNDERDSIKKIFSKKQSNRHLLDIKNHIIVALDMGEYLYAQIQIYEYYYDYITSYVRRKIPPELDWESIVEEIFEKFKEKIEKIRPEEFESKLYWKARSVTGSHNRKNKIKHLVPINENEHGVVEDTFTDCNEGDINKCIEALKILKEEAQVNDDEFYNLELRLRGKTWKKLSDKEKNGFEKDINKNTFNNRPNKVIKKFSRYINNDIEFRKIIEKYKNSNSITNFFTKYDLTELLYLIAKIAEEEDHEKAK